jgi:hypothetical protein
VLNRRRRVLNRRGRMLNRRRRVLNRRGRVLNRRGRVLKRRLRWGVLLDHRRTRAAAVADRTARTRAMDDRAGVRRHPVAAYRAAWVSATLDDGLVPSATCRAVLSRKSATVRGGSASQCGAFLAEDSAMSSAGRRADPRAGGVSAAATNPRGDSATAAGVGPQTRSTRNGGTLRLRRRVAAQHVALAAQRCAAPFASDAQPGPARTGGAGLTTDSDTPERT